MPATLHRAVTGVQPPSERKASLSPCQVERQRRLDDGSYRLEHRGSDSHALNRRHKLVALRDHFVHFWRGIVHLETSSSLAATPNFEACSVQLCVPIFRILPYDQINFDRATQMHEIEHSLRLDRRTRHPHRCRSPEKMRSLERRRAVPSVRRQSRDRGSCAAKPRRDVKDRNGPTPGDAKRAPNTMTASQLLIQRRCK
jgi:hypothetical protein